jgi:hypothetical protein
VGLVIDILRVQLLVLPKNLCLFSYNIFDLKIKGKF